MENIKTIEKTENYQETFLKEEKTKQVLLGHLYIYKKDKELRSCFIDGVEFFIVNDVYDFLSYKEGTRESYIRDVLKEHGLTHVLNKWELLQGGFTRETSYVTLTNKDGIVKIVELLDFPDMNRIEFVQREVLSSDYKPEFIETKYSRYMQLPVSVLNYDKIYQRRISQQKVREIVKKFDMGVIGALIVSEREDGYYLIDGQHRVRAMELLNIKNTMCLVHKNLTIQQEAELFRKCNNSRKAPSAMDNFRAAIIAGDETSLDIFNICEEAGYKINMDKNKLDKTGFHILSISGLLTVHRTYGRDILKQALEVFHEAETQKPSSTEIHGMSLFLKRYENDFSKSELVKKVSKFTQVELIAKARSMTEIMGGHVCTNYARIILNVYNTAKQNKLEDRFTGLK